jgi:hypothetical protein
MAAAASLWVAECFSAPELGSGALVAEAARRLTQAPGPGEAEWSAWCGALELVAASLSQVRGPVAVTGAGALKGPVMMSELLLRARILCEPVELHPRPEMQRGGYRPLSPVLLCVC